jgi:hypothetical protein
MKIHRLHPDAPPPPLGMQPREGVEFGCGRASCGACYEPATVDVTVTQCPTSPHGDDIGDDATGRRYLYCANCDGEWLMNPAESDQSATWDRQDYADQEADRDRRS